MFIGHYAVALATKKAVPNVSLGTLILSAQLADLIWPVLLLLGLEHVRIDPGNTALTPLDFYDYPISNSLIGSIFWSIIMGVIVYIFLKEFRTSLILGLVVFSHWILDFITHRPDLPLGPGINLTFGLGLWNSVPGTIALELILFVIGIMLYTGVTSAKDKIGKYGFWSLMIVILLLYFGNIFGPPPPSASAIAVAANGAWLFIIWAYWADHHRTTASPMVLKNPQ